MIWAKIFWYVNTSQPFTGRKLPLKYLSHEVKGEKKNVLLKSWLSCAVKFSAWEQSDTGPASVTLPSLGKTTGIWPSYKPSLPLPRLTALFTGAPVTLALWKTTKGSMPTKTGLKGLPKKTEHRV